MTTLDEVWVALQVCGEDIAVHVARSRDGALRAYQHSVPAQEWATYREYALEHEDPNLPADHLSVEPEEFVNGYMGERQVEADGSEVWGEGDNFLQISRKQLA